MSIAERGEGQGLQLKRGSRSIAMSQLTEEEGSGSIAMSIAGSGDGSTADRGRGE